jgi:DNA-binding beta-propeller fold protein YncE
MLGSQAHLLKLLLTLLLISHLSNCSVVPADDVSQNSYWPQPPEMPRYIHEFTITARQDIETGGELPVEKLKRALTGEEEIRQPVFKKPMRMAASRGMIYVTDTRANLVHVFDIPRKRYFALGYRLQGKVIKPIGIALDNVGNVYVADQGNGRVVVYDRFGLFIRFIGDQTKFDRLTAVAVSPSGDQIYLLDTGGVDSVKHEVLIFNRDGKQIGRFGQRGSQPGEFNLPIDIVVAPNNEIGVLDAGNFRVQWFDRKGKFLRSWGEVGNGLGQLARPRSLAVDLDGAVYITDSFFSNVQIFDENGRLLLPLGDHDTSPGPGKYALISGISADETSRIYVLDQYFKKLEVFRKLSLNEGTKIINDH